MVRFDRAQGPQELGRVAQHQRCQPTTHTLEFEDGDPEALLESKLRADASAAQSDVAESTGEDLHRRLREAFVRAHVRNP